MNKKILFPFSFEKDFNRGYSWTMELALRMDATLFFFTVLPANGAEDKKLLRSVYHSLLAARGNYLQYFYTSKKGAAIVKTERCIEKGDFTWSLLKFVKKTKFDIVVVDPRASTLSQAGLENVVEHSNGVIVLPERHNLSDQPADPFAEPESKITEDFYTVLSQSELYKLRSNFFRTLGQDKRLFNYLRGFFGKNQHPRT